MKDKTTRKSILIVGAGFGGIALAKKLAKESVDVLLLDKNNYHTFQPLLYQVATGGLEAGSIAYPVRRIFRGKENVHFRMAEVNKVDLVNQYLTTSIGDISYDYLVVATGSTTNYFNFEPVKDNLLTLKSVADALDIRSYLMQNLERALTTVDLSTNEDILNVAIIGGGPAGIELAGALAEMKKYVLPKDFPEINFDLMNIYLFEAMSELLANMSEESSTSSLKFLNQLGVQVHLNAKVKNYDGEKIFLEDGSDFLTDTVIWTAGVKGSPIDGFPKESIIGGNRLLVDEYNRVQGTENVFSIGDVAARIDKENPRGLPMLAPVAVKQATHLAENILRNIAGKDMVPFKYVDKGVMATIGRKKAVVDLPHYKFQGAFAWFIWMFIHIISLVGFRNKVMTFIDWAANYINYDRPLGLIIRKYTRKNSQNS